MSTASEQHDPVDGLLRFRRYTWWSLIAGIMAVLLVLLLPWAAILEGPVWRDLASWVVLVLVGAASIGLMQRRLATPISGAATARPVRLPTGWALLGAGAALALGALMLASGERQFWPAAPALVLSLAAAFLPTRQRRLLVGAGTVAAGGVAALAGWVDTGTVGVEDVLWAGGVVAVLAFLTVAQLWTWDVATRLDEARRMAGELAVADERLRFAADLHDIQGHHLQVIALKSELAARLADSDAAAAAAQMREVQRLSAEALRDTRAVVRGYRRTSLDAEIANATRVLDAADIDCRMHLDPRSGVDDLPEPSQHLLGLVMREATTNVLRHSSARRADVRLEIADGVASLWVRNDGALESDGARGIGGARGAGGAQEPDGARGTGGARGTDGARGTGGARGTDGAQEQGGARGTVGAQEPGRALGAVGASGDGAGDGGLPALAARLEASGGSLQWHRDDDVFVVRASMPVGDEAAAR